MASGNLEQIIEHLSNQLKKNYVPRPKGFLKLLMTVRPGMCITYAAYDMPYIYWLLWDFASHWITHWVTQSESLGFQARKIDVDFHFSPPLKSPLWFMSHKLWPFWQDLNMMPWRQSTMKPMLRKKNFNCNIIWKLNSRTYRPEFGGFG